MKKNIYFVGVDVGSKSVRAGVFSASGCLTSTSVTQISVYNEKSDYYEQSSDEIWKAVSSCVQKASESVDKNDIKGIGFDATCSLVVLDNNLTPISVSSDQSMGNKNQNIIMWMDHRAKEEADIINSKPYKFLKYVGGKVSLEMQMPKLLWLKRNLPSCWNRAGYYMDLPDFLTWKATGCLARSLCSLVCKWTYIMDGVSQGWDEEFLKDVGLQDLLEDDSKKIGQETLSPGDYVGGLSKKAADDLGLLEGTPVGASIIDAHAGGLALFFAALDKEDKMEDVCDRLGLICGTSTCHMCLSREAQFVQGVWGPYLSAIVPNLWLHEGGQSAAGSLVDYIVHSHPAIKLCPNDCDVYTWLEKVLERMKDAANESDVSRLTRKMHIYPDFHGNRSPLADPSLRGMVCGLSLDSGEENLAIMYLESLQALSYGTRDIVEQLKKSGHDIKTILMCGGLSNSRFFSQISADVLGLPVLIPETKESMLLGAAMLGASASGVLGEKGDVRSVAEQMAGSADTVSPKKELFEFHERKYKVFKKMQEDQKRYCHLMEQ